MSEKLSLQTQLARFQTTERKLRLDAEDAILLADKYAERAAEILTQLYELEQPKKNV